MASADFAAANLDSIRAAANGSEAALRALQEAAFIHIVGSSNVDFSAATNGLALVGNDAVRVGNLLAAVGMGYIETKTLNGSMETLEYQNGEAVVSTQNLQGQIQVWKPSASNPFKKSSGGGGGGGSSGSKSGSVSKATTKLLDNMEKKTEEYDNLRKIAELKKQYHDIRGEIQGVIGYTKIEADIIRDENTAIRENIAELEKEIAAKEKVISKTKSSSKKNKQAKIDLIELQNAYKQYNETLLENINRLEEINEELEQFREDARQTTISVQDIIRETIEGHKEYQREILDGTVNLEDLILETIQERYEKERELAIETAEAKKEALQEEIDAIDELIDKRRELIEEEETELEIAELEEKISRIAADPTRKKELLELEEQLSEKRKDLAWKTYEDEMKSQKESLNDQIESLDDYIEYVNEYYDDLLENPEKLIAEMKDVITKTDNEIIEWLENNMLEFSTYTDAKKKQMIQDWQEIIDQMRGVTDPYKDEILAVMKMTDSEIISWLKRYNVEFASATKEQQDSFIYSWKETLKAWREAYEAVAANVTTYSYYIDPNVSIARSGASTQNTASKVYATGGLNYETGWHWLDGTLSKPERVLSAYQTELFEDLIKTLHEIRTFNVGNIMQMNVPQSNANTNRLNIENIQVNVERLDSDADYEELAERVGEVLKGEIIKIMPVGGIVI